jgi:hypothetical protein
LLATDPNLLVRAAVDGVGILYTLWDSTAPLIATGHLVPLLETWMPSPSDGFFLYFPGRRQNLASLRALIDFLRTKLKADARAIATSDGPAAAQKAAKDGHQNVRRPGAKQIHIQGSGGRT